MSKKRILIIDDERSFASILKLNLEETGQYEVQAENNGSKGLSTAQDFRPDLILLDLMMRECPGHEVARQIRSDDNLKDVPIVFVTATPNHTPTGDGPGDEIEKYAYITKPASVQKIIECIEQALSA